MTAARSCKNCGAPILWRRPYALHCSDACRRAFTSGRPGNKERERERHRAARAAGLRYTQVNYPPRPCAQCGAEFTPKQARSVLCSKHCKWLAFKASRARAGAIEHITKPEAS